MPDQAANPAFLAVWRGWRAIVSMAHTITHFRAGSHSRVPVPSAQIVLTGLAHCVIWSLAPPLFLGNLHSDTVEATSWATHWDLGYFKHPPLVAWVLNLVGSLPGSRMVNDLLLSQATVAITAAFLWRTVGLFANRRTALAAVVIYLASPPATYFATQVNHNSFSIPFGAAILCFGLAYMKRRRSLDIALLGLAAGLGLLTKYQTAFNLLTLGVLAVVVPAFRWVWRDPRSYVGALLAFLIFGPHLWWDYNHGWRTILYASTDRPLRTFGDFGYSLNELLDGLLMCAVGPLLAWLILGRPNLVLGCDARARLGVWIGLTPIVVMIALGFGSGQILRQGWLIPQIPGVAIALALMYARSLNAIVLAPLSVAFRSILLSVGQVIAFATFLMSRSLTGNPVAAYSLDGRLLASSVQAVWNDRNAGPIPCIVMPNRSYALAMVLYANPVPLVVDLDLSGLPEKDPLAACRLTGGLAITPDGQEYNNELNILNMKAVTVTVPTWPRVGAMTWTFQIYVIPPPG